MRAGMDEIGVDGRILFFVTILSAASGILFGLAPALALAGTNLIETLKNRGTAERFAAKPVSGVGRCG